MRLLLMYSAQHPGKSWYGISFTRLSLTLILQATNAGVRRPGYKANQSLINYCLNSNRNSLLMEHNSTNPEQNS